MVESQYLRNAFPNNEQYRTITLAIADAVAQSFGPDVKRATRRDLQTRTSKAIDIVLQLRSDLTWGLARIKDQLPYYLKKEVNGESWEPDQRSVWIASDGV
jgi:hypothetical protein